MRSHGRSGTSWVIVATLALLLPLSSLAVAAGPRERVFDRSHRVRQPRVVQPAPAQPAVPKNAVLGVVLLDEDPAPLFAAGHFVLPRWDGPFPAHDTTTLFVLVALDARVLGDEDFDLVARFRLPDGSLYQTLVRPVVQDAAKSRVHRPDLSPVPVRSAMLRPWGALAKTVPHGALIPIVPSRTRAAVLSIPVSGSWITQHGLYGEWGLTVEARREREVLGSQQKSFVLLQ